MNFAEKRVLLTGGSGGVGSVIAQMFLDSGARVALHAREADDVDRLPADQVHFALGDVTTSDGCQRVLDQAVADLGGLDILVCNNEISPPAEAMQVTEELWDGVFDANLLSAYFCSKFALPALRQARGNIVMVASVAGLIAGPADDILYSVSKAGLINMAKALALELAADGIRVNAVCPGLVEGMPAQELMIRIAPLGRVARASEIGSSVLFLASDMAAYCTGTVLVTDGGCYAQASRGGVRVKENDSRASLEYIPSEVK